MLRGASFPRTPRAAEGPDQSVRIIRNRWRSPNAGWQVVRNACWTSRDSPGVPDALGLERAYNAHYQSPPRIAGYSRLQSTRPPSRIVLWATATPIPPTSLPSFVAPRCESPKPAPSIVLFERPTASACARSRSSAGNRRLTGRLIRINPLPLHTTMVIRTVNPPPRSSLPLIRQHQLDANLVKAYAADSCGLPTCEMLLGSRLKPSLRT